MKALHFGAGNIGRGFIGKLLSDAGIEVTFADVNHAIITAISEQKKYPVNIVGENNRTEWVNNVNGIDSTSNEAIEMIIHTDLITTAVGPTVLSKIAPTIAKGIIEREKNNHDQYLNIIACENMVRGTSEFKNHILQHIPENILDWVDTHVGFIDSAVDRIVPPAHSQSGNVLEVTVETFSEWVVDKTQFKGPIPNIKGMEPVDNLMAFVERKLFTLNTGHAITAYLGFYEGLSTIRESILNNKIRDIVKAAMIESGEVLIKRYGFDREQHHSYINKILSRFENPNIHDETARVGREPIRKLSHTDRLIKPLLGTFEYHLEHDHLLMGVAAALSYRNSDDKQAVELATMIEQQGILVTIHQITNLHKDNIAIPRIVELYEQMQAKLF